MGGGHEPDWSEIARVETARVGADQAVVSWSWNGKPPSASRKLLQEDLFLQVVPAKSEEKERRRVVDIVFSRILSKEAQCKEKDEDFMPVHTSENGQRLQWHITIDEQKAGKKLIRLIPNYTYEVSLGIVTSKRYIQKSNVSRIRLGFVVLNVIGSGELSKSGRKGKRKVQLGQNKLLSKAKSISHQKSVLAAMADSPEEAEHSVVAQWQNEHVQDKPGSPHLEDFTSVWLQIPGISITALSLEDLEPRYHKCFQTYGYRDDFASCSAVAELMTELSEVGTISKIKSLPQKHLWILSSSMGWEVVNASTQLGELLARFLIELGGSKEEAKEIAEASHLKKSESGRGCRPFAFVGVTPVSSTTAFRMPKWTKNQYTDAQVKIALSFDDSNWFPAFKWTGHHWEVWAAPMEDNGFTIARVERVSTSKDLKLRRNHIIIDELEDICKYFAPDDSGSIPFDLTAFLQIVFDMIEGYHHGSSKAFPDSLNESLREQCSNVEYEIHDPALPSPQAFVSAVASLSTQLETVLAKLLRKYQIASQLVEAGVVEFVVSRMNIHHFNDQEKIMNSMWLLISLTARERGADHSPRQYASKECQVLLDYSKTPQPRLLAEVCRRGGVGEVIKNFESCWVEAAIFANYEMLNRLSIFMLQVAEMKTSMLKMSFSYSNQDLQESISVHVLQSQLPVKREQNAHPTGKLVIAEVEYMKNNIEPEKSQAWGPGWANSGELLTFSESSLERFDESVVIIPAAREWKEHSAIMLQACRLVWLASVAGAVSVIFVWPGPTVQQIHPNLNFSQHAEIPSYIIPESEMTKRISEGQDVSLVQVSAVLDRAHLSQLLQSKIFNDSSHPSLARQIGIQFHSCFKSLLHHAPKVYEDSNRPIRILCLDGGGVKGIATIYMLKQLVEKIKGELEDDPCVDSDTWQLANFFDLIVGTSAGGIISLGLGSGMTLNNIEAFYNESVHEIFASKDSYWEQLQRGPGATAARRLQEIITSKWPERSVSSMTADSPISSISFHQPQENLGRLPGVGMLTSLVSREPSRTCMLKSYCSDSNTSIPYLPAVHKATILQSIRATSAAPYYLEEMLCHMDICTGEFLSGDDVEDRLKVPDRTKPFHLEPVITTYRFVDGAISVNNPTCAAILEARATFPKHPLVVVSLGTGTGTARVPIKTMPSGIGVVLQNLIASTADVSLADAQSEHMLTGQDVYFRFCPSGDVYNCDMGTNEKKIIEQILVEAMKYMESPSVQQKLKALVKNLVLVCKQEDASSSESSSDTPQT